MSEVALGSGLQAYLRLLRYAPGSATVHCRADRATAVVDGPDRHADPHSARTLRLRHRRHRHRRVRDRLRLGTPLWGRLMDRSGQIPVLVSTALSSAALLISLAVAAVLQAPSALLIVLAAGAGLAYPPVSPAIRAAWRVVFADRAARKVAFALDSTSVELIFVTGPLLLSALLAFTPPVVPLVVTAALMAGGVLAYCRTDAAAGLPGPAAGASVALVGDRSTLGGAGLRRRGGAGGDAAAERRFRSGGHLDGGHGRAAARRLGPRRDPVRRDRRWQHRRRTRLRRPRLAGRRTDASFPCCWWRSRSSSARWRR